MKRWRQKLWEDVKSNGTAKLINEPSSERKQKSIDDLRFAQTTPVDCSVPVLLALSNHSNTICQWQQYHINTVVLMNFLIELP